ncbi:hypothetical protein SAY86_026836 [Trapa natans]|uniref:DVL n=1 Tax=Trapa natans TaxID=22666 RepID=A0AAN7KEY6_TRANT|nr:hypothetical protein SAY86_026836 [Trapa natans]
MASAAPPPSSPVPSSTRSTSRQPTGRSPVELPTKRKNPRLQLRRSFTRKFSGLVKEQRARFYIMRRCVVMLICWNDCPEP